MNLPNDDLENNCNHQKESTQTQCDYCEKCGAIIIDKVIQ